MARIAKTSLEIGGEELILSLNFNIMCDIEEHFGKSLAVVFANEETVGLKTIRDLVYLTAKKVHKDMTPEKIGDLMEFEEIADYTEALVKLIEHFNGEPKNVKEGEE